MPPHKHRPSTPARPKPDSQTDSKTDSKTNSKTRPKTRAQNRLQTTPQTGLKTTLPNNLARLFLLFHLVLIPLFAFPVQSSPFPQLRELLSPYLRCTGLTESWDTFAPNPKRAEQYLQAQVLTASGATKIFRFPRMENLPYPTRYRDERYRKFQEAVLCPDCPGLWPDIDRAIVERMASPTGLSPTDPPIKITLIEYTSPIDPAQGLTGDDAHATAIPLSELNLPPQDVP